MIPMEEFYCLFRTYKGIEKGEVNWGQELRDNLLKLTSLESDHPPFEPITYRLDHQLRRVILSNEPQWRNKDLEMDISLDKITIHADEDLMDQVWINLIHNSIKFTPDNGKISVTLIKNDFDR
ncbi:hypothetical protein V7182_14590 [Neobacillus drentensis]|uniref:sensor histidine kinase n=1 Tax=Neobacillus drentensis TaxID=220684 RepID=UPI0030004C82